MEVGKPGRECGERGRSAEGDPGNGGTKGQPERTHSPTRTARRTGLLQGKGEKSGQGPFCRPHREAPGRPGKAGRDQEGLSGGALQYQGPSQAAPQPNERQAIQGAAGPWDDPPGAPGQDAQPRPFPFCGLSMDGAAVVWPWRQLPGNDQRPIQGSYPYGRGIRG